MDPRLYTFLKTTALLMVALFVGWSLWDSFLKPGTPGDAAWHSGNNLFEDGRYERALAGYAEALAQNPAHIHALRGYARALAQLGRHQKALAAFNEAIAREPGFAFTYANRGILRDRMGEHRAALADYEKALELNPETGKGPNWLTRFLRLQTEKPPGIADRARYLRAELAKPEGQRILRLPALDEQQRSYKQ